MFKSFNCDDCHIVDVNKCPKQIKLSISLYTCASFPVPLSDPCHYLNFPLQVGELDVSFIVIQGFLEYSIKFSLKW